MATAMNNPMEEAKRMCVYVGFATSTEENEYPCRYLMNNCHEGDGAGQVPTAEGSEEYETMLFPMLLMMMITHYYYKTTDR